MSVHPTAVVAPGCEIADDADVGPFCVIGFDQAQSRADYYGNPHGVTEDWPPTVVGPGATIGAHSHIGHGTVVHERCLVEPYSYIGERCVIGARTFVRYRAWIAARVTTGADCVIGGFLCSRTVLGDRVAFFGAAVHRFAGVQQAVTEPAPVVESEVLVGFNAVVVGGVRITHGTIVPVGSIVKGDRPDP